MRPPRPSSTAHIASIRVHVAARGGRSWKRDAGFVLIIQVLMLSVLMTMTALAVDVGSFYSRAAEVQKASDAAALAAVVWMPDDVATATSSARDAAARNGFTDGSAGITVTVAAVPGNPRQVRVSITDPNVPTLFGRMITNKISITRDSVAEYVLAVPLGSPDSTFGNQSLAATAPNFWAAINGYATGKSQGDPFATHCGAISTSCSGVNADYRASGYLYAVEVPPGSAGRTLTVEIFDSIFVDRGLGTETSDTLMGGSAMPPLQYELYEADATPLDNSDNPTMSGRCSTGPGRLVFDTSNTAAEITTYKNQWSTLCTFNVTRTGVYPLRVKSSGISGQPDQGNATAQYAVRSSLTGAGAQPRVYGLGDMSIFTGSTGLSEFYLAEVAALHAGKTFEVELFDPGDGSSGTYNLSIVKPDGGIATCRYTNSSGTFGSSGGCTITTRNSSGSVYDGKWLSIRIDLGTTYSCSTNCWWKVKYDFGGGTPTDRTTWRASILGDPVHLVE
jgi:hypothetical protein